MKISVARIIYVFLGLIVFFIPMEDILGVGGGVKGTLLRYLVLIILPFFFFDILMQKKYHRWSGEQSLFFCFLVWVLLSMTWTYDLPNTQTLVFTYTSLFFFLWLIVSYVDTLSKISVLTIVYIAGCVVSFFFGSYSLIGGPMVDTGGYLRYAGGGLDQNECSFVLNLGCLFSFMQVFLSRSKFRADAFLLLFLVLAWGVILTGSRAGFYGLAILWFGVAHFVRTRVSRRLFWLIFIPFLICAVFFLPSTNIWKRASEGTSAETFLLRQSVWTTGLNVWKDVPLQGVGAGAFLPATTSITKNGGLVAHNTFVSVLVELGIIGAGLYFSIFFLLIYSGRKQLYSCQENSRKEIVYKYFLGLLMLLIFLPAFLSLTFEYKKMLWFAVGLSIALRRALIYERTV